MGNQITIDDIARALGVSKTTVSRAISGKGRVGEETRNKVLEYIDKYNYKPNMMARALAQQKTYNIAVAWPDDYNAVDLPFFQRCVMGVNEVASGCGYDIVISLLTKDDLSGLERIIQNHKVDGVILTRTLVKDKAAQFLKKSGIPFVAIGSSKDPDIVYVDNDNFSACKELTSILIAKGLKRLALIGGSSGHVITSTRYQGFVTAFEDADLVVDPALVFMDADSTVKIETILQNIMKKKVDGVICMDDSIAGEVLTVCRHEHIKVPKDLRIASFYNSSILENAIPSVTSLNFNDKKLGSVAAKTLIDMIDGAKVESVVLGNYEVSLKESTK